MVVLVVVAAWIVLIAIRSAGAGHDHVCAECDRFTSSDANS